MDAEIMDTAKEAVWDWLETSTLPTLNQNEVTVWALPHSVFFPHKHAWEAFASEQEHTLAQRHQKSDRRNAFLLGNALSRILIAHYLGVAVREIHMGIAPGGKPFLKHEPALFFNISHAQGLTVIAFSFTYHHLGCDVENATRKVSVDTFSRRFYHAKEQAFIQEGHNQAQDRFFTIWTRKEAVLKAHGMGIRTTLSKLNTLAPCPIENMVFYATSSSYAPDHFISVAAASPIHRVSGYSLSWEQFCHWF